MKKLLTALLLALPLVTFAQPVDMEGCKDHPLLTRMPNFYIESCVTNFNSMDVYTQPTKKEYMEGTKTVIRYAFNDESGQKFPSQLQIIKNYENAIIGKGGKKIMATPNPEDEKPHAVFSASKDGKNIWVVLSDMYEPQGGGEVSQYTLTILEVEAMKQDISAGDMMNALNKDGFVSLYINFDTGKSTIKPESQKVIDQLYEMLKSNSSLKISIEGHTDNVGSPASNKTLSESRAKAVMDALVAKGIDKTRLVSKGFGQEKPVADNGSEDGKAKNRRVEIRKM
jgi:outer membrane protein OmpA-like peptidoglycan-associated protein